MSSVISAERGTKASLLRNNLPLFRSSFSLSTAAAIAAFGGFVYWVLIARVAPATRVGEAAALFSSIQFVNYATGLGLPIAVARYGVTKRRTPSVLFNWAIVFTVASSFVGAAIYFAIVLPMQYMMKKMTPPPPPAPPATKPCPECLSDIPLAAKRCSHCAQPVPAT